jgi:hypothetical protein
VFFSLKQIGTQSSPQPVCDNPTCTIFEYVDFSPWLHSATRVLCLTVQSLRSSAYQSPAGVDPGPHWPDGTSTAAPADAYATDFGPTMELESLMRSLRLDLGGPSTVETYKRLELEGKKASLHGITSTRVLNHGPASPSHLRCLCWNSFVFSALPVSLWIDRTRTRGFAPLSPHRFS